MQAQQVLINGKGFLITFLLALVIFGASVNAQSNIGYALENPKELDEVNGERGQSKPAIKQKEEKKEGKKEEKKDNGQIPLSQYQYMGVGTSLDFLSGVSASELYYDISILLPNIFDSHSFVEKLKSKWWKILKPNGFGFSFIQGRTVSSSKATESIFPRENMEPLTLSTKINHTDETKLNMLINWGHIISSGGTKNSFKATISPALMLEFRQKTDELERFLIDKTTMDTLNNYQEKVDKRSDRTYYGLLFQAEANEMYIRALLCLSDSFKYNKIFQVNALHKKTGLLIGGEVRTVRGTINNEFEVHIAKAFGLSKLMSIFGEPDIKSEESEE